MIITRTHRATKDFFDRAVAIYCGEHPTLRLIYREGEIGVGVCPIDENGHTARRHSVPDA
jgi:hypothetical protein